MPKHRTALAVIPARYDANRLPGKPLAMLGGRPMVVRVMDQVRRARRVGRVIIATDDERVVEVVQHFGGEAVMTPRELATGSDRVAWVARTLDEPIIINVQGDEPLIDPDAVDAVVGAFDRREVEVATGAAPLDDADAWESARVKVVTDIEGRALYFSRSPIPHGGPWRLHVGIYGFRRDVLLRFAAMPQGVLERTERLEQLRLLENGVPIHVVDLPRSSPAVDTVEDLTRLAALLGGGGQGE